MDPEAPSAGGPSRAEGGHGESLAALFTELAMGNLSALDRIYDATVSELYALALWRTGSRADAEDAVQTVFLRLAETRVRLSAVHEPRSYLLAMAHRAAVDRLRGPSTRTVPFHDDASLLQASPSDPGRAMDARRATSALLDLPAPQPEAIFLHHFSGLTFAAIGRVTGVPTFTAASRFRD